MGVLEFFGTLIKNDITSSAIKANYTEKSEINHFLLDFNSIIHVQSQKLIIDINLFFQLTLKYSFESRSINSEFILEKFRSFKMEPITNLSPENIIKSFHEHFTKEFLDKMIITRVINNVLSLVKTYVQNKKIQTLFLAIDGVPSKGKMIEQKQRRYMGTIVETYKEKILLSYKDYLQQQPNFAYEAAHSPIRWSKNNITPGTEFMHRLSKYLKSDQIQEKFKINRPQLTIIVSDMYEIGEGEKKIVNYIKDKFTNSSDSFLIYSPDADMILLLMLLPIKNNLMLRHNQQKDQYDLINISLLKNNIAFYINQSKYSFLPDRISFDIVCLSTIFGNDFVPKIETINVKKGFQNIMDVYTKTLLSMPHSSYLVEINTKTPLYVLSLKFLKSIFSLLLPEEVDFITNNDLYAKYINIGVIKNVFSPTIITSQNLYGVFNEFKASYDDLKNLIRNNGSYTYFLADDDFMNSLKKSISIVVDDSTINLTTLTNAQLIQTLKSFFRKNGDFPRLNINLNTYSHSINDPYHKSKKELKDKNLYEKELYKFNNMLDEYYIKFNAQPLSLSQSQIPQFYREYFDLKVLNPNGTLTPEATVLMQTYVEGLMWVFNYYFNDKSYINRWFYQFERAPLLQHIYTFIVSLSQKDLDQTLRSLKQFQVTDIHTYFNPLEQLIYVSPMTSDMIKLLPKNYAKWIKSPNLDPFLKSFFINVQSLTNSLYGEKVSKEIDCRGIPFLNKCFVKAIGKNSSVDDEVFLKLIRKVKPTASSEKRSRSKEPDY